MGLTVHPAYTAVPLRRLPDIAQLPPRRPATSSTRSVTTPPPAPSRGMPNGTKTYVSGERCSKSRFWRRRFSMKCSNRF